MSLNKKDNKKIKGKDNNKKSNQRSISDIKLLSLAPNYEINDLNGYDYLIDNCLKERRLSTVKSNSQELNELKNRNIAITGDYGCGKSSIINSFFAKHNDYKYISVSMGLYGEQNNNEKNEDRINNIYLYILKQILYTVRPVKLPFSNYKRNDKSGKWFYIYNGLVAISIILYLLLFLKKLKIDSIWIMILTGLFVFFDIMYILQKINIKSLSLNIPLLPGSVELDHSNNNGLLNENIEELIHFFLSTDYSIVVFEDLDRDDSYLELVKTLSMINYTINNSIKGKTIQFIYSISDRCFKDPEERTKAFDFIIPIKPFVNDFNSVNRLDKLLTDNSVNSFSNYNECLKVSCDYLKNPRLLFDFVNEFSIYYNDDLPDGSKEELFYLILYKITFPNKFYEFIKGKNIFAKYFTREFEKYSTKLDEMDFSLIPIPRRIELLEEFRGKEYKSFEKLDSFEQMLININIITRNYNRLFINRDYKLDKINMDDERIISKIRNNEDIYNDKFSSIETVFQELNIIDFQRDSIINMELLKYTEKNNTKYIQQFIDSITEKKLVFIVNNEVELSIIRNNKDKISKLWAVTSNMNKKNESSLNTINMLLFYIFKYCDIEYIQSIEPSIVQYLQSTNSYLSLFNDSYEEIKEKYQKIEYIFNDDVKISNSYSNILIDIFTTNKIPLSYDNVQIVSSAFKIELESSKIVINIKNIKNEVIKMKFIENINVIINLYISRIKIIDLDDESLKFLLNETEVSIENLNKIIEKSSVKIKLIEDFKNNTECYELLVSSSKYELNENNLISIYNKNKDLLVIHNDYIIENGDLIVKKGFDKNVLEYIVNNALINLNYSQLIKFLDLFKNSNMIEYIRVIIEKNSDLIDLENYHSILCYDNNLEKILTTGQKINVNYKSIIIRLNSIGLLSSYETKDDYLIVRVKKGFKVKKTR